MASKIIHTYFFYLFVFTLFFGVLLYNIAGLKATDELSGGLLLILYGIFIFTTKGRKFNIGVALTFFIFIFYLCYSIYIAYSTRNAIILDFLIQIRPYLTFFIVSQISPVFSKVQKLMLKRFCFTMWLFFIPIGIYGFITPAFINSAFGQIANYTACISCLSLAYLFCGNFSIRERFTFLLMLATGLLAPSTHFYSIFLLSFGIILYFHHPDVFRFKLRTGVAIVVIALIILHITRVQITEYMLPANATVNEYGIADQSTLYKTSVTILKDFFPLGSGLASFGTYASGLYGSEIYTQYGIESITGSASKNCLSLSDSYYPSLAQFGIIGIILYLFFWIFIVYKSLAYFKQKGDIQQFVVVLILVSIVFIENISDSFFTSNKGYFMMMFLGVLFGKKKKFIHISDDKKLVTNPVQTSLVTSDDESNTEDTQIIESIAEKQDERDTISAEEKTFQMPPIPIREEDMLEKDILAYTSQSTAEQESEVEEETAIPENAEQVQSEEVETKTDTEEIDSEEEEEDFDEYDYDDEEDEEDFDDEEEEDDLVDDEEKIEETDKTEETEKIEDEINEVIEASTISDTFEKDIKEIDSDIISAPNETLNEATETENAKDTQIEQPADTPTDSSHNESDEAILSGIIPANNTEVIDLENELSENTRLTVDDELQSFDSLVDDDEDDILSLLSLPDDNVDKHEIATETINEQIDHTVGTDYFTESDFQDLQEQHVEADHTINETPDEQPVASEPLSETAHDNEPDISPAPHIEPQELLYNEVQTQELLIDNNTELPSSSVPEQLQVTSHPDIIDYPTSITALSDPQLSDPTDDLVEPTQPEATMPPIQEINTEITSETTPENIVEEKPVEEPIVAPESHTEEIVNKQAEIPTLQTVSSDEIQTEINQQTIKESIPEPNQTETTVNEIITTPNSTEEEVAPITANNADNIAKVPQQPVEPIIEQYTEKPAESIIQPVTTEAVINEPPVEIETEKPVIPEPVIEQTIPEPTFEMPAIPRSEKPLPVAEEPAPLEPVVPTANERSTILNNEIIAPLSDPDRTTQAQRLPNDQPMPEQVLDTTPPLTIPEPIAPPAEAPIVMQPIEPTATAPTEIPIATQPVESTQDKPESDLVKEYREIVDEPKFQEKQVEAPVIETKPITPTDTYAQYLDELLSATKTENSSLSDSADKNEEEEEPEDQIDYII